MPPYQHHTACLHYLPIPSFSVALLLAMKLTFVTQLFLFCALWLEKSGFTKAFQPLRYSGTISLKKEVQCVHPRLPSMSSPVSPSSTPTQLYSSTPEELRLNPKKESLVSTYGIAHKIYLSLAFILFVMPDRTLTARLPSKWGGAAGYLLAAQSCKILQGATRAGRLASDTYKRLNIGLIGFCLSFWTVPAEAGFLTQSSIVTLLCFLLSTAKVFGLVLAITGFQYGADRESEQFYKPIQLFRELGRGCFSTLKGLRVKSAKKALAYRNLLILVLAGMLSSLLEGIFDIRYREAFHHSAFDISIQWSAISRLFLIATMIYSLKDAAERDRLTGSTFIQMNLLVGGWALAVGLAQGLMGYWIEMLAFSLPFFIKAYRSILEKKKQKQTA